MNASAHNRTIYVQLNKGDVSYSDVMRIHQWSVNGDDNGFMSCFIQDFIQNEQSISEDVPKRLRYYVEEFSARVGSN